MEPAEEDDVLLNSARDWCDQPEELDQRIKEVPLGLTQYESEMMRHLPTKGRILDIGCAAGRASIALAKKGHEVIGIDISENLLAAAREQAKEHGVKVKFQAYKPVKLPFPDASFDAVLMLKVYCYQPRRLKRIAWLCEVERVLRPEGCLFISQHIIDGIFGSYEETYDENYHRISSRFATLEIGDNFTLSRGKPPRWSYVHFFMLNDLRAEVCSTSLRIVLEFTRDIIQYFIVKKPKV